MEEAHRQIAAVVAVADMSPGIEFLEDMEGMEERRTQILYLVQEGQGLEVAEQADEAPEETGHQEDTLSMYPAINRPYMEVTLA